MVEISMVEAETTEEAEMNKIIHLPTENMPQEIIAHSLIIKSSKELRTAMPDVQP